MNCFSLADLTVRRVEEFVDPNCDPMAFFPDLTPEIIARHLHWIAPQFWDAERNMISITMQTWVLQTKHHTILIDTCNGNHKPRPYFPAADQLNTPYLERLKAAGVWVVGLDGGGDDRIDRLTLASEPLILVFGAEGRGLSPLVRKRCDVVAAIPLRGRLASLNVAAAGAIACYEVARQRAAAPQR